MISLLFLLTAVAVSALEPTKWERKSLDGTPVSMLVPAGSEAQQGGRRHPGFDEAAQGWQLQSTSRPERGTARMILYLQRGDITVYYSRNGSDSKFKNLDDYVESEATGRKPEAEQYGKWKGYTVRLIALKDPNRHPAADEPFGDLAIHAVEFGPSEYLAISLHAHPDAVKDYLPYFYKVRDSIQYAKTKPVVVAKNPSKSNQAKPAEPAPPPQPPRLPPQPPLEKRLVLLPHLGRGSRMGRNYYPYVRVLQCPQGFLPRPSDWPRPGAIVCRPIRTYSGQ